VTRPLAVEQAIVTDLWASVDLVDPPGPCFTRQDFSPGCTCADGTPSTSPLRRVDADTLCGARRASSTQPAASISQSIHPPDRQAGRDGSMSRVGR
jgi:hypothetical protein